jgi:manganese/zinc/iron transport system substrate-binding protein
MKQIRLIPAFLFIVCIGFLVGCSGQPDSTSDGKIRITTTVGMVTDLVENIVKDNMTVNGLMGAGVDPHLYKASHGDIDRMYKANLILYNGLHLEGKMVEVFEKIRKSGKPAVAIAEGVDESLLLSPPGFEGFHDPHIWFDVSLWLKTIPVVLEQLNQLDPENKELYQSNAEIYKKQLEELHNYCKTEIATIPKEQRVLITAHDAFGYFGKAYEIEVIGLQGLSTASEYGLKDLERLKDIITSRKIKAVFVESSIPKRSIEAVVEGCKSEGHDVKIGGELFSDAMGEEGTTEGTYIGMVKHNVDTIVSALR